MANGQHGGVLGHLRRVALVPDGSGMTDGQLLECFLTRRDEVAFEALVRRHGPMVLGVCRRLLGHAQDAEDAFQATFLVLVSKGASIQQRELVGNWLYGAAHRAALEVKAARRRVKERQVSALPEPVVLEEPEVWRDLRPILDQELNRLPEKYRVPVVLCDLEGRTRRDIARQLGIPEGTLSGRLTTARRLLARRLARHGLALSAGALAPLLAPGAAPVCLPSPLVISTVQAAALLTADKPMASVVSASVAAITKGVVKAMWMTRLEVAAAFLVVAGLVAAVGGTLVHRSLAGTRVDRSVTATGTPGTPPVARDAEVQKILDKYLAIRPDDKDLAIFQLDWAPTLKAAREKAAREKRPIFLLVVTNSFGNLYTGHC
jgi:RNA polymerase sigma factor (sigma-70 family)